MRVRSLIRHAVSSGGEGFVWQPILLMKNRTVILRIVAALAVVALGWWGFHPFVGGEGAVHSGAAPSAVSSGGTSNSPRATRIQASRSRTTYAAVPPPKHDGRSNPIERNSGGLSEESPQTVIAEGGGFHEALALASTQVDRMQLGSMVTEAYGSCWAYRNLQGLSVDAVTGDLARQWARRRIGELCKGFNADNHDVPRSPLDTGSLSVSMQGGRDAAIEMALNAIAVSKYKQPIMTAGRNLLKLEWPEFMLLSTLPGQARGPRDIVLAWDRAVNLALCGELFGCGPNAPVVALFCIRHGCQQGRSLREVYRNNLAPPDFAVTMAYANWIRHLRNP